MKEEIKAYDNVLGLIGNTPLIKLNKITETLEAWLSNKPVPHLFVLK